MIRDDRTPRLPSMPIAIQRVLALAERRSGDAAELHAAVQGDPALVLALLRAARTSRPDSVRAAIEHLGPSDALRVCLGFRSARRTTVPGFDGMRHWRRSLLATAYARAIAQTLLRGDSEQIQTATALCHVAGLPGAVPRRQALADWLAVHGISEPLRRLIVAGRDVQCASAEACVALAECMAEVWLEPGWEMNLAQAHRLAQRVFGAVPDLCSWVFGVMGPQADELDMLLRMRWPSRHQCRNWRARAQRLLNAGGDPADWKALPE